VGIITTQYPEAYRIYSEGRTLYLQSRFKESIPYMEKAIAIDPDFAMAYRSIATAYSNMGGHPDEVKEYFNKAMEKTDRLALREKLLIQAQYAYYVEQDYKKSLDIWTSFLKEYPEDNVANQGISVIYQERLDLENAIPHLEICRNNRNEFVSTYNNLGNVYSLLGEYEKAREVYREHMEYFGETVNMQVRITNSYAFEGRLDEALLEANKALAMSPLSYNKAGIYFLKGDFAASEAEQRQWIKTIPQQLNTIRWLAIFDFTQGKYQQALKRLNEGLALAKENNQQGYVLGMLHLIGWCHLADGDHETALSCAFEMRDNAIQNDLPGNNALFLEGETQFHLGESEKVRDAAFRMEENLKPGDYDKTPYIGQVLYLNGLADLAEKDYQSAANNLLESNRMRFRENSWYEAHIQSLYHLGEAHLGNGDLQAARDAYEEAINLTTGKMYWGDLWAKSHYKLGEIYEKLGNRTKAIEHTEKFLEMWKDADPGLPEVDDAKKRLAGLR
jgi:tetratricopeptide (TPR) repeat protein